MASTLKSKSSLGTKIADFDTMLNRFGVVTVMNAKVYDAKPEAELRGLKVHEIVDLYKEELCTLDTLKIANITQEGPEKTITGGRYSNPLVKFGKSARIEMQDALGNGEAIAALCGGVVETFKVEGSVLAGNTKALHIGEQFVGPKTIIGDSFFIDQITGSQVPVTIIIYQMLPDSLFNFSQDAEGDASVFDMNGDLLTTEITIGTNEVTANDVIAGVFYSVIPAVKEAAKPVIKVTEKREGQTLAATCGEATAMFSVNGGLDYAESVTGPTQGTVVKVAAIEKGKIIATDEFITEAPAEG